MQTTCTEQVINVTVKHAQNTMKKHLFQYEKIKLLKKSKYMPYNIVDLPAYRIQWVSE